MEDCQQRVVEERAALDEKFRKLDAFINGGQFSSVSEEERGLLVDQWRAMGMYLRVLKRRIRSFTKQTAGSRQKADKKEAGK